MISLTLMALFGCGGNADIDQSITVSVEMGEHSNLIAEVVVSLEQPGSVWVEYIGDESAALATSTTEQGLDHEITVAAMRADSEYEFTIHADYDDGSLGTAIASFTTGQLPPSIADFSVDNFDELTEGYTFFGPAVKDMYSVAIDAAGNVVWYLEELGVTEREADREVKPLGNGELLLLKQGAVRIVDLAGNILVDIDGGDLELHLHHDLVPMPNGGYLGIAADDREMFIEGVGSVTVRGDSVLELDENGELVWQWSSFDYLDTTRFPGALSLGQTIDRKAVDWTHANGIQYNDWDDTILLSLRHQSQVILIDHVTGDLLWTFGEDGDFELTSGEWFYNQHAPELLEDGRILIYDNGNERPTEDGRHSRGVIYQLDYDNMTATQVWEFDSEFYTGRLGDIDLLENGNVLICAGGVESSGIARLYEVPYEANAEPVWQLNVPGELLYRGTRVSSLYE
jgi:arylsulfate sulfotransferase